MKAKVSSIPNFSKSFKTSNVSSIFHLVSNMEKIGYNCYTPFGTSWIGKKIISTLDGMTVFFNKHNDTVRINGRALAGESWLAYEYPDSLKIIASVVKHDTGNFLRLTDSVKTIGFQAYDAVDKEIIRPINDFTVRISKNYGLIKTLNFSLFPDITIEDFYEDELREYNLIGLSDPEMGVQNLSWFDVHDFHPGDEIHVLDYYTTLLPPDPSSKKTTKTIKKYLNRTDYKDSIVYILQRIKNVEEFWLDSSKYFFLHDTIKSVIRPYPDFNNYPGEPVMGNSSDDVYLYSMYHTNRTVKYHFNPLIYFHYSGDSCWQLPIYDGCTGTTWYIKGLGGPYSTCQGWGITDSYEEVVYFMKADSVWRTPLQITGIEDKLAKS